MPNVTVALSSALQTQLTSTGVTGWAVYFDAGGANPTWTKLTGATTQVTLTGADQKLYFILQSTDSAPGAGNSVQAQIKTESQISPTGTQSSADALNYRYDSFEVSFTPAPADAGNLTDINGFGIPMAIEVVYSGTSPTTSASRGYNLSGGTVGSGGIWNELASAGGSASIQYFAGISSGGYTTTQPRMAISPATAIGNNVAGTTYSAGQWSGYIASLASGGATTSGGANQIQIAGYFNGAPDASGIWHNAGFYAYNVTTSGGNFVLAPSPTSQIQGTITISPTDLANSIYLTQGNATVSGLANGNGTGNTATLTMNTGANNEWGAVLRDFVAGLDGGYWNSTATSLNPNVTGSLILNKEWNQDPTYAFGGSVPSGPGAVTFATSGFYDPYAKVFFDNTNSYGNGYSDFLTRAYNVGPLINVSDGSGSATDSNNITVSLFADTDTTSGYTPQIINNYLSGGSGGYLVPSGVNTNGIQTTLNFNVGTTSLKAGTPVTIVLKGATSASDVALPVISAFGNYQITSGGGGYTLTSYGNAVAGVINIEDLPVTPASAGSSSGVDWYQIDVGTGAAQKNFNLYETVDSAGNILNPAYAGQAGAIAIDGLAAITGTGTGKYISATAPAPAVNGMSVVFQNGGTDTLDPSLMAVVPLSSASLPNGAYPEPKAPLVGLRPGYTASAGAPFLESYQAWSTGASATVYNGGLVFGWTGADSAAVQQRAAINSSFVSAYTNKIGGGDVARLSFTSVSGAALPSAIVSNGGYLTATADGDGNWATAAPVQFGNGTYTVQMQEFLPTDSAFANALNSASVAQSFTVSQGAVISTYNLSVDSGQTSTGLTIAASSGAVTVNSGGTTSATMISAGGIMYMAGGSGDAGSIILGQHQVWSGATASNTTVASGGADYVYGAAIAAVVNGAGVQVVGGTTNSANASGTTLNAGGYQHVKNLGWASNTVVLSGGNQVVDSGGFAIGTTVYAGGILHVSSGGSAGSSYVLSTSTGNQSAVSGGAIVSGGALHVLSGGVTLGALLQGSGSVEKAWSGGSAASTTLQSGAYLYVYSGGYSLGATVGAGGVEDVWGSGSIAANATVQSGGYEYVFSGAYAYSATLQSGGEQWVWGSGTTAVATTILAGAKMVVHGGGMLQGATLNGGTLELGSGGGQAGGTIAIITSGSIVKLDDSVHLTSGSINISGLTPTAGAIDFGDIGFTSGVTSAAWAQGAGSGTLTLTSGALQAAVTLFGNYITSSFKLAGDGAHGTMVTDPAVGNDAQNLLAQPHA